MKLSEDLAYRGLVYQTTYTNLEELDKGSIAFYFGVDPSAQSMTVGNLAALLLALRLSKAGHKPILLVGGATGMIGDPDGKKQERDLLPIEQIQSNKNNIASQFKKILGSEDLQVVDNYDWFKNINYIDFLRDVGKKVPLRTMLGRDFIQSRLGEEGSGISYAEFSYSLIQGYDFLHLFREYGVKLQISGADQWGNSIAGVDLVRRSESEQVNILSIPLIVNKNTGVKFGKTEEGAVWLDPILTSPTMFYQFWINTPDNQVEEFLKIYTFQEKEQIDELIKSSTQNPKDRIAQKTLAYEVTKLVHGEQEADTATKITDLLTGKIDLSSVDKETLEKLKEEIGFVKASLDQSLEEIMVEAKLSQSKGEARKLIESKAVRINNQVVEQLDKQLFVNNLALLRRGKAFKDSALIELK